MRFWAFLAGFMLTAGGACAQPAEPRPPARPADLLLPDHPDTRPVPRPVGWERLARAGQGPAPGWALRLACADQGSPTACVQILRRMPPESQGYPVPALCSVNGGAEGRCVAQTAVARGEAITTYRLEGGGRVAIRTGPPPRLDGAEATRSGGCWRAGAAGFCARRDPDWPVRSATGPPP